jgi:hypothetical protein
MSVSINDRVVLASVVSLELCTNDMWDFMGLDKPSSPVTTSPNHTPCLKDVVRGGMRPRAKTSPVDRGPISME